MALIPVHIKHAGKTYDLNLDPDLPPNVFKDAVYNATGVPLDRMKVMVKGGTLKEDSSWKKIAPKAGQTFMVIGAAGDLPKPPAKPIVFLEDMDDSELAEALAKPVGLRNLGNTCYMNATVQALRAIPELQVALTAPALHSTTPLPASLRDLYHNMSRTTDSITPIGFLQVLRQVNPQFAEVDRSGKGGMMGDAEECYQAIINTLRNVPGLDASGSSVAAHERKLVDQYLMGEMRRELTCDEAPEEPASVSTEQVLKIECNIINTTNFMLTGILNSLDTKVEKNSPTLGRQAIYSQKSRLTRLPGYLTVHMVRFAWRADIGKKAKIMRKVKFPLEFDALDLATDELKAKLLPVSRKLKEVEKERMERRKVRKRTKTVPSSSSASTSADAAVVAAGNAATGDVEMADAAAAPASTEVKGGDLEAEGVYREKEAKELAELVDPSVKSDVGCSATGLYDLVAIVTHKGAAADAGHYIGFVKKSVGDGNGNPVSSLELGEDDEDWYKFDDEKVSIFPKEKLATLDGGGEDSSAYVLLYRSKSLD
ncbi:uncharacterized protein LACBIDRAFT_190082 [Laccaria bicolor S238N-H82]|uniref:Ubiquitin carboxyl-terminal hydrolase n=1 Tax=Laccaria bicolor (strain S238N-H82 / ATCC MYA-4686) TaxID=486041 RepID=B0D7E9_LACBS|nr:uncharacterized protein LACBIDRAFT_190082 [Laccaria bicolor S238N-H82]EDR09383.1 predicted protein [Laccaria bicolor S238N-H82]|eukprot:XP_001879732.1 predicted protein [Laccaria bicolor S238N-H82]